MYFTVFFVNLLEGPPDPINLRDATGFKFLADLPCNLFGESLSSAALLLPWRLAGNGGKG